MDEDERAAAFNGLVRANVLGLIVRQLLIRLYGRDAKQIDALEQACLAFIAEEAALDAEAGFDLTKHEIHQRSGQEARDFFRETQRVLEHQRHTGDL